ncbi:hypothetical protein [Marinobacter algicola]|uniref:hypothetical protein n=1 Tax=Marinobacter algicola TaxID=236100 RepID=UPI003BA8B05E
MGFYRRLASASVALMIIPSIAFANEASNASGAAVPQAADDTVALGVDGINRHTGDDDPGVLYILPWQPPTLPRRSHAELDAGSEELLEPEDPLVLERHRTFRETLNPLLDSTLSLQ